MPPAQSPATLTLPNHAQREPPPMPTQHDIAIIGAGPAGLSLAISLAQQGRAVALIERLPAETLAAPPYDGREIALTQGSATLLQNLGAWQKLTPDDTAPLGEAIVLNGPSTRALRFHAAGEQLGHLVPNHRIRQTLFEAASAQPNIHLITNTAATDIATTADSATLTLSNSTQISARLIVAADTRFSEMRRRVGIPARMLDFGKTMLVCRMAHALPHNAIATEWFGIGQTIAILPLHGNQSSLVITLPAQQAARLAALPEAAFNAEITQRYAARLGDMHLVGTRHLYPLVAVYASRFVGNRLALVGDAAVGMHPVTAHGFNFGLSGQHLLANALGDDPGAPGPLARYQTAHRRATLPLYLATNAIARLYTDDRPPARALRAAIIGAGSRLAPLRHAIAARLLAAPRRSLLTHPA